MIEYNFTGNPFVDTGLSVLVAKARELEWSVGAIHELTPNILKQVIGDAKWLAFANRRLKAFNMVVGNNSPLTNTSSNPSLRITNRGRLNAEDDKGFQEYVAIMQGLVTEAIMPLRDNATLCECCGAHPSTTVLPANGKEIGRDWFPLAGSLGSDAQMLPAGSRAPKICSLCLLAIQVLPLGVVLLNGKLACFQSTSWEMTQLLVEDIYRETQAILASTASNEKVAARGSKGRTTPTAIRLLRLFENLQVNRRMLALPTHVTMNVWLFSNSGTGADCDMIEIPNNALIFLWEVARRYRSEVETMLQHERKQLDYQLLECIRRYRDYEQLYPMKGKSPASKELFSLYQTQVMRQEPKALRVAEKIVCLIKQRLKKQAEQERKSSVKGGKSKTRQTSSEKFLQRITERHPFRDLKLSERNVARRMLADLAEDGLLTLEEYVLLFPCETLHPLHTQWRRWLWIWFYLNHENLADNVEPLLWEEVAMFTNPKIKQFACDVFDDYVQRRGLARVKRDILDRFRRGEKITTVDLQRWFCKLAETREGYTNEDWDNLCRDENGNNVTSEVRFQFRLEFANLYRQSITEQQPK